MKKLTKEEMKKVSGGATSFIEWQCYSGSAGQLVYACSDVDPEIVCAVCDYSDCHAVIREGNYVSCDGPTGCLC